MKEIKSDEIYEGIGSLVPGESVKIIFPDGKEVQGKFQYSIHDSIYMEVEEVTKPLKLLSNDEE